MKFYQILISKNRNKNNLHCNKKLKTTKPLPKQHLTKYFQKKNKPL